MMLKRSCPAKARAIHGYEILQVEREAAAQKVVAQTAAHQLAAHQAARPSTFKEGLS
jgi:molybdate-binding protein